MAHESGQSAARGRRSEAEAEAEGRVDETEQRTRGGWVPVGTAAERRAIHRKRGTARGERTRRQIIDAARRVFERDGYLAVGVADIAREASVAHGSFYTYFSSKFEVFRVICDEVSAAVDASVRPSEDAPRTADPVEALRAANLRYIETYRANARIYAMQLQLNHIDEELKDASDGRQQRHFRRVAEQIRRWQARGVADPTVDASATAVALVLAMAHLCYWMFDGYDGDEPLDVERYAGTINGIWVKAVDLRRKPNRRWLAAQAVEPTPVG